MKKRITKAMLLAAGLGTRLRPLTLHVPKPLLPLDGALLIDHQLRYLAQSGVTDVMINIHHLGPMIMEHVGDGSHIGVKVFYSEEPQILGTGGGIKKAAPFFSDEPFIVLNSDALIDADIGAAASCHLDGNAAATMVLKELSAGESFNPVGLDSAGNVTGFGNGKHFFTGLQILDPEIFAALPPAGTRSCLIEDGYKKLLESGARIASYIHSGYFNDLGTPERYDQARRDVTNGVFRILTDDAGK